MILVRAKAWWFTKVPVSLTLMLVLLDGRSLSPRALEALVSVIVTVCAAANYGYALNDLFDIDDDARVGRVNAAAAAGRRHIWTIASISAICALAFGALAAGPWGIGTTLLELSLPLAYSVPPLRLKERTWLGICSDALAAHAYPALLALLAVTHWKLRPVGATLGTCVMVWAVVVGLRGILSHQLYAALEDRSAGLRTIVHDLGGRRVERFVVAVLLPIEAAAFVGTLVESDAGWLLWLLLAAYAGYEALQRADGRFLSTALRVEGQRYVPLVDESFYKVWGPLVLALDAARFDLLYLLVIPVYGLAFRRHLRNERLRFQGIVAAMRARRSTASGIRSSGGS